jgi:hypothetical protein
MAKQACIEAARETALTLINNAAFYGAAVPVLDNLARKLATGKYDAAKAPKAFVPMITRAISGKEWAIVYGDWRPTGADRLAAAGIILDHYADQIREKAEDLIGPAFLCVDVCNWSHDMYGNPTAQHHIYSSTDEGGRVRLLNDRKVRRAQVGYGDRLDNCPDALRKSGFKPEAYELTGTDGDRSADSILANYRRLPLAI